MTVINKNGYKLDLDIAAHYMDKEIRESLCGTVDTDQEFFSAYEKAHEAKYGEEWELSKENPCW